MSHSVQVSDELYRALETLARQEGTSLEALAEALLKEHLAEREAISRQNAEWEAGLGEALARAGRGENPGYHSTDALFAALEEVPYEEPGDEESGE